MSDLQSLKRLYELLLELEKENKMNTPEYEKLSSDYQSLAENIFLSELFDNDQN